MKKALVILSVIFLGLFTSPEVLSPLATTTTNTQVSSISADITNLVINKHGTSLNFYSTIKIVNQANDPITIDQQYICGFGILITARTDYENTQSDYNSPCNPRSTNTFPFTYNPGSSYEYFNASVNFYFGGYNSVDLPQGFYYFEFDAGYLNLNGIHFENALYLYFGNNTSLIKYNLTQSDYPPYTNLPISEQISLYTQALRSSSSSAYITPSSNFSQLVPSVVFLIAFLLTISLVLYNNRGKRKNLLFGNPAFKVRFKNADQNFDKNSISNFCPSCYTIVNSEDSFCQNCGKKLI